MRAIIWIIGAIISIGAMSMLDGPIFKERNSQYREIRHKKEKFLTNNTIDGVRIINAEINPMSARPTKDYDLFTVLDANNEIYDIKVFDTNINGVFKTKKEG